MTFSLNRISYRRPNLEFGIAIWWRLLLPSLGKRVVMGVYIKFHGNYKKVLTRFTKKEGHFSHQLTKLMNFLKLMHVHSTALFAFFVIPLLLFPARSKLNESRLPLNTNAKGSNGLVVKVMQRLSRNDRCRK